MITLSAGIMNLKIINFFWNVFHYNQRLYYMLKINNVTISNKHSLKKKECDEIFSMMLF